MKIIVDANILIIALLRSRDALSILTSFNHSFYGPTFARQEVRKYRVMICDRCIWSGDDFDHAFQTL